MAATGQSPIGEIINSSPFQKTQSAASTYDYVQDDTLYINEKMKTVMVSSEGELNRLYDLNMGQLYSPGTIAYTPGFTNIWHLNASGEWVSILGGGSGDMDSDTKKYAEYFVKTVTKEITEINDDQGLISSVGDYAFGGCSSLTTVSFPKAASIGNNAFGGCSSLTTVSFPKATSINVNAFSGCSSLTTVSFPKATSVGDYAFAGCNNMTDLYLPNAENTYTNRSQWFLGGNVTVHYNTSFDADGNPIIIEQEGE